jgi:Raf kinase inhibitor-like YbhB/YbcL family protein
MAANLRNLILCATVAAFLPAVAHAKGFTLSSPDLAAKKAIGDNFVFNGFGCTGKNLSPALNWRGAPAGTKSFALLVHDPDAPTGGAGWWHWLVVNLPASSTGLPQGVGTADGKQLPAGAQQFQTDFGSPGYGGPCPPQGDKAHRYNFTLYALKVEKLELATDASASLVGYMVNANALGKATLTATYGRK